MYSRMTVDVLVIGAGISGLACAQRLAAGGARVVVLERSRGVGGRCATRRLDDGQPIDHGLAFLHGDDPDFLAALDATDAEPLPGWPRVIEGNGPPCQPQSYEPGQRRLAFREGSAAFPRALARGLEIRREQTVTALATRDGLVVAQGAFGELCAPKLVLALAFEQALALARRSAVAPLQTALEKLAWTTGSTPMLAAICLYPLTVPSPSFDVLHPGDGSILQNVFHDSGKRLAPARRALVLQSLPSFAELRLRRRVGPESWGRELLAAAAERLGAWAATPELLVPHRWEYARVAPGASCGEPSVVPLPGGAVIHVAGDCFSREVGAQGAFRAGRAAALAALA